MWIGLDVVRDGEIDKLLERRWFRQFVYAPEELALARSFGGSREREFLTGRFAAKEAALKVIGTGVGAGVVPRQVAILRSTQGAPIVELSGMAAHHADELGMTEIHVTIAHKPGFVVAVAMGVPATGPPPKATALRTLGSVVSDPCLVSGGADEQ